MAILLKRTLLLLTVVALAAGVGVLVAAGVLPVPGRAATETSPTTKEAAAAEPKSVAITLAAVTPRPVQRRVQIVGSLWGRDEIVITPKVEGRVVAIHHDVGDVVKPGAPLLEVEDVDYRLAVNEAQRALDLELAKLGLKQLPPKEFDVRRLPAVLKAASIERNALSKRDRQRRLSGVGVIEEREQMEADYAVAQASYQQTVLEAETTVATARYRQAILETAQQRLKETKVVVPGADEPGPPVEYVVSHRMASVGEMLRNGPSSSMKAFGLVIDNPLKMRATVPERHLGEVKVDQPAEIEVEAYRNERFRGRVARVNKTVDRTNRTFQVEVEVPNDARRLSAGCFARGAIATHVEPRALTVPEEALVTFAGVIKVFVRRGDRAHEVKVTPATRLNVSDQGRERNWTEVHGDLKDGDEVITSGQSQLADGTLVRLRNPDAAGK